MASLQSIQFVQLLPAELRATMVRGWEESLRAADDTIATVEASLGRDLRDAGKACADRPAVADLLQDLQTLAEWQAQRALFADLLGLAAALAAKENPD